MYSKFLTLPILAISLTLFTACGGGSDGDTSPKVVMKGITDLTGITDGYKIVEGKPTLELDAITSTDNGVIKSYTWTIDDRSVSLKAKETIDLEDLALEVGKHEICLAIVDGDDKTITQCKEFEVVESSLNNPTAVINVLTPVSERKTEDPITLSASESTADQNGEIVKYEWLKDGEPFGDNKPTQIFESNSTGDFNITVTITDNEYNSATRSEMITVLAHTGPTAKLTMLNPLQKKVFSIQSSENKTFGVDASDTNLPYQGGLIFLSAAGSHDDYTSTDDNLTYIWDGRIFISAVGGTRKKDCFSANQWLKDVHRDSNTTGEVKSQAFVKRTNIINLPEDYIIDENRYNSAKYIYPYVEDRAEGVSDTPYVFFPTCSPPHYSEYDRLEVELTVIDNLHGTQTHIKKIIKIKPQQ